MIAYAAQLLSKEGAMKYQSRNITPLLPEDKKDLLRNMPKNLLVEENRRNQMIDYPEIYECRCSNTFNRLQPASKREEIDRVILEQIQNHYPLENHPELHITSIASAGAFNELVLHSQLTNLGYTVHWTLVDPLYFNSEESTHNHENDESGPQTFETFQSLVQDISINSTAKKVKGALEYFEGETQAEIILGIDMDLKGVILEKNKVPTELWNKATEIYPRLQYSSTSDLHTLISCLAQKAEEQPLFIRTAKGRGNISFLASKERNTVFENSFFM